MRLLILFSLASSFLLVGCDFELPTPAEPANAQPAGATGETSAVAAPPATEQPAGESATAPETASPTHDDVSQADLERSLKTTWRLESIALESLGEGAYRGTGVTTDGVTLTFDLKPERNGYRLETSGSDGSGGHMYMAKPIPGV